MTWAADCAAAANRAWHIYRARNPAPPDYPLDMEYENRECYTTGYAEGDRAGATRAMVLGSKIAPAIASLDEFIHWLREPHGAQVDVDELRRAWLLVKEWIGPVASAEHRNAIEELDIQLGVHEDQAA